jgi:prepilin signal peptidase PulO-like enzyme (type II secretory pathway)
VRATSSYSLLAASGLPAITNTGRSVHDPWGWPAWYLAVLGLYGLLLLGLAGYDARHQRIPNVAVYPALGAGLALAVAQPVGPWWSFVGAGLLAGVSLALLALLTGGIGLGDAKLAALIGLVIGWPAVLVALFAAFAIGAVSGVLLIAMGRIGRRQPVPFGPALAAGAVVGFLGGPGVVRLLWPGLA